jgi:hypothetical protein
LQQVEGFRWPSFGCFGGGNRQPNSGYLWNGENPSLFFGGAGEVGRYTSYFLEVQQGII